MYGVWLSECCTDRHRQHARRGLDGSAATAAAADGWNNTSHFVGGGCRCHPEAAAFFIHGYLQDHFTFPNVSVIFYTETFVYPEFREGLPKLLTVPAYCKH
uniref:Unplaced genomic scaffold supercont1.11, whole genome shotgun sequence n=1 Tax=Cryptococcus bacillisporus CA1280 TaxID=1296109 RepID=A0A0D0VNR0_CRYGA|nr:hypothetical protein I312_04226 [Cryptococcus bacillisporus CA1280]